MITSFAYPASFSILGAMLAILTVLAGLTILAAGTGRHVLCQCSNRDTVRCEEKDSKAQDNSGNFHDMNELKVQILVNKSRNICCHSGHGTEICSHFARY